MAERVECVHCKDCRWYGRDCETMGECLKCGKKDAIFAIAGATPLPVLWVSPDSGCVQFEAKESAFGV